MGTLNINSKNAKIVTVLIIAALLMSCGSNKADSGSSESASRTIVGPGTVATTKVLAYCNQGSNSTNTIRINMAVSSTAEGAIDNNYVHLKITNLPAAFKDDNTYFVMWKWYAESSGFSYVNNSPLTFKIVSIATGVDLTSYMSTLNWSTISSLATTLGATTPAEFFQKVRLFVNLNDPTAQYDAITVSLHSPTTGAAVNRVDALLPIFNADPRDYAVESTGVSRAPVLQALHPFAATDYSLWSLKTFENKANEFCTPFSQQ